MSHFITVVAVRGVDNPHDAEAALEDILDPWDENKDLAPYPVWLDQAEVDRAMEFYREHPEYTAKDGGPVAPFDEFVKEGDLDAFNEWIRQAVGAYCAGGRIDGLYENGRFGYLSTYNPDSKWDWWQVGGRWNGFFQLKPKVVVGGRGPKPFGVVGSDEGRVDAGALVPPASESSQAILGNAGVFGNPAEENFEGRADIARKGDIDFETARVLAAHAASETYDKFQQAVNGLEVPPTWQEFLKRCLFDRNVDPDANLTLMSEEEAEAYRQAHKEALDAARIAYREIPWVKALNDAGLSGWFSDDIETYRVHTGGREAFIEERRAGAATPYALVLDGEWYGKGQMGWFGMSSNEREQDDWNTAYNRIIESLPDDVYLCAVDMHI